MCGPSTTVIGIASLFGIFQSLLWGAVSVTTILIHYCIISVADYKDRSDFFRVTIVKIYFEGPRCVLDGGYLGNFFEVYTKSIHLLGREMMVFLMIAYLILSFMYFFLSLALYLKRHKKKKLFLGLGWSILTLIFCVLDVLLTYALVTDAFKLMKYFLDNPEFDGPLYGMVTYIPLLLAAFSSRLVIGWLWNFIVAIYVFFTQLCGHTVPETPVQIISRSEEKTVNKAPEMVPSVTEKVEKVEEKPQEDPKESKLPAEDGNHSLSFISENYRNHILKNCHQNCKRSLEGVTRFSNEENPPTNDRSLTWCYSPVCENWDEHRNLGWDINNKGYVNRLAGEFERKLDFEHNLKNFESGQKRNIGARGPVGKPVGIPVPPPLPPFDSCNC